MGNVRLMDQVGGGGRVVGWCDGGLVGGQIGVRRCVVWLILSVCIVRFRRFIVSLKVLDGCGCISSSPRMSLDTAKRQEREQTAATAVTPIRAGS